MSTIVFIPASDELIFDHPERLPGRLVPYNPNMQLRAATKQRTPNSKTRSGTASAFRPGDRQAGRR